MSNLRFLSQIADTRGRVRGRIRMAGALLVLTLAGSQAGIAHCTEKPTVWMSEQTAASHLLASRPYVFPAEVPLLARIRSVIVTVTVNRAGRICNAKASAGPMRLRKAAEEVVKTSWRYRPFLLDHKPVVVQFPVTVNFLLSADWKDSKRLEVTEVFSFDSTPFPRPLKRIHKNEVT